MPAPPHWHARLHEIRKALEAFPATIVDRAGIERLFGLRRRQAIRLMAAVGGHQIGRTYLIDRLDLLGKLEVLAKSKAVQQEKIRKQRVIEALESSLQSSEPRRRPLQPISKPEVGNALPPGMRLAGPGQLVISFASAEELLGQVMVLAQKAASDYSGFVLQVTRSNDGNI